MQDAKGIQWNNHKAKKQGVEERQSDATSKETVDDLDQTETKPDTTPDKTSIPSPDGTPSSDRGGGRADGSDTGGPM